MKKIILGCLLSMPILPSKALEVFSCEPEWAALTREIAQDTVSIYVATSALQDVHHIEARPSLIAKIRKADFLICTGAELEQAWLPTLLEQSGNQRLRESQRRFFAAEQVDLLDKPTQLDRRAGDVHAAGNPHVHLDPRRVSRIAEKLAERLSQIDPDNAPLYKKNTDSFLQRWQQAQQNWQQKASRLKGQWFVIGHDNLRYLTDWLGLEISVRLEPKPGLPPTSAHLAQVLKLTQEHLPLAIVQAAYEDHKSGLWLAERINKPHLVLPFSTGGLKQTDDLFSMMDRSIDLLTTVMP